MTQALTIPSRPDTAPPLRLAPLVCSNTEILEVLGVLDWVVAVDSHSDSPGLEHAVRLGPDQQIDVPLLKAQAPDLVLASLSVPGLEKVVQEVRDAGLKCLVLDPITPEDIAGDIRRVGEAVGLPELGQQQAEHFLAELNRIGQQSRKRLSVWPRLPRVAVEWWPKPIIAATQESWVTHMLDRLGAENAFAARPGRSSPLTLEEVRAAQPDLMTCSWCGVRKLRPEVMEARGLGVPVVCIPETGLGRPGPRLLEGMQALAEALAGLPVPEAAKSFS
ncbi:ABC transporter substrate-binding protein [Deinococcus radiophilus]|uniref:Cobalamin-binding protein n=1 Tax=Deinococcus radiophilus TaxID=32062 RepID=A0A3S0RD75_9DEIO|nr:ABC transporter substrate-binding protein [Deinococcus radiophilus]RTR25452.1 cobalamin-binding protein [Deinococcus radiophilus]UFA50940.1 ABC transporter substrate-binding protein [Deinococcus radiophilus]